MPATLVETYKAVCCVCEKRYGQQTKTVDFSHGYCRSCGTEAALQWFPDNPEAQARVLATLED